ncbi:MAG: hypoxanthine phosphoribosyltransferase [Planctomycetota bacterium]|jgi:hypoxanthine phosphoribosyltransferase
MQTDAAPHADRLHDDIERVLVPSAAIAARVAALAAAIGEDYAHADGRLTVVPVMTGSLLFAADLVRALPQRRMRIQLATVSSYGGTATASRGSQLVGALPKHLEGHHVLVVDDILDSGGTLRLLRAEFESRGAASVRACMLLRKRIPSAMSTPCEYVGFDIDDEFVVGYGLDYDDLYRNLPYVGTLRREARGG